MSDLKWIDVHAHLEMLEASPEEIVSAALDVGVEQMITIGTHPIDNLKILEISKRLFPKVCCTVGIHPHETKLYNDKVHADILEQIKQLWVVGIGEIGLDYFYEHSDREIQKNAFERQLEIAAATGLPVEIHTRDAEADTVTILEKYRGRVKGLIHCFTGTQWLADHALDLGFDISFSGIVTFKKAQDLRDVLKTVPLDRIHVETDSPFLTPIPFRGKKNSPAMMVHTAKLVAETKGITEEALSNQTRKNAHTLFARLPVL